MDSHGEADGLVDPAQQGGTLVLGGGAFALDLHFGFGPNPVRRQEVEAERVVNRALFGDRGVVAATAPAGAFPAALWSSRKRKMVGGVGHAPVLRRTRGEAKRGPGPRRTSAQQERDRAGALGRGCGLSPSRRRRLTRCCVAAAGPVL